jgi:predicted PurR-regulated permease PerM
MEVFVEQMGMARASVFYPTHGAIDANRFDIRLARPDAAGAVNHYIAATVDKPWRRPVLIYLIATILTAACLWLRRIEGPVLLAMLLGACGYLGLLFIAAPAADARYIFPPNLTALLLGLLAAGGLFDHWRKTRGDHGQ